MKQVTKKDKIEDAALALDYTIFHAPFSEGSKQLVTKHLRFLVRLAKQAMTAQPGRRGR